MRLRAARSTAIRMMTALVVAAAAAVATADIVYLKDGSRVGGKVLSESSRIVRIRTDAGKVKSVKTEDVERIERGVDLSPEDRKAEEDAQYMPGLDFETRKEVHREAKRFGDRMKRELSSAARPNAWVFGDHPQHELSAVAESVQRTFDDFVDVYGCEPEEALPGRRRGEAGAFYVFQFEEEPNYQRFIDRVLDRMRDETVSDERMRLMKRQKGFWIMSPRHLMARYRGPGTLHTLISNASHQASHAFLMTYEPAGTWMPWWFLEGVATWQEIRLTGNNLTYCLEVGQEAGYANDGIPEADESGKAKVEKRWRKQVKRMVSGRAEREFGVLGGLSLNELVFEDVQQSWSIVDWLSRTNRLVAFTKAYKEERTLVAACEKVLKAAPTTVHQQWRKWVIATY